MNTVANQGLADKWSSSLALPPFPSLLPPLMPPPPSPAMLRQLNRMKCHGTPANQASAYAAQAFPPFLALSKPPFTPLLFELHVLCRKLRTTALQPIKAQLTEPHPWVPLQGRVPGSPQAPP